MPRKPYRLLRDDDRTRVKYLARRYKKPSGGEPQALTNTERKWLHDKRKELRRTLEDMTWLAEELPEHALDGVFTAEHLTPLFVAIIHPRTGVWAPRLKATEKNPALKAEWEPRHERIIAIARAIIEALWGLSADLAPVATYILSRRDGWKMQGLEAVFIGE